MSNMDKLAKELQSLIAASDARKPKPYDTQAKVLRVDGDTAWVHIPGGVDETPVKMTINAKKGDAVNIRVAGGSAWITGNSTRPPTDDTTAIVANTKANIATVTAAEASDVATDAKGTAVYAKDTAESVLVYDHDCVISNGVANFTARVFRGGVDIHTTFDPEQFTWYLKNETSTENEYLGYGYTMSVALSRCGYGSEVVGIFSINDDSEMLSSDNSNLTNNSGNNYSVRASGDSVRVRELSTSTTLYSTDKLMVIGTEDEHLTTIETVSEKLWDLYDISIEEQPLLKGNNSYENLGLLSITNSEIEALTL